MKQFKQSLFVVISLTIFVSQLFAQNKSTAILSNRLIWQTIPKADAPSENLMPFHPNRYTIYVLDETTLKQQLFALSTDFNQGIILALPLGDGTFRNFRVWQTPMMPDELGAKYPEIKTFTAVAVNDQRITAKLDFTLFGFHAMIFETDNTTLIDPYDHLRDGFYMVHYKKDEVRSYAHRMKCGVGMLNENPPTEAQPESINNELPRMMPSNSLHLAYRTGNGWQRRTYKLALSADHFYCQAATALTTPTIAQCLSAMTTSMNRINGVYNREFSVEMQFCAKEDTLIYPTATGSVNGTDPFNAIDANPNSCLTTNQSTVTTRIGSANYDVGHVFTTGGGGLSMLGVVCNNSLKAESVTGSPTPVGDGFDIDYVAHEMGHEFGSNHTFNNNMDGSCGGNAVNFCAYEPGSGGTIMDYAGICTPDDLQMHSDPYFSASSLVQIANALVATENACARDTATLNNLVSLATFSTAYTIPYKTPFELTGPTAVDSAVDTANTYDWLQWNLGDFGKRLNQTYVNGPIFRSFNPAYTPTRIFPNLNMVLSGVLSNAGTEGAEGEKAPDTARSLKFKMVVRDFLNGNGCFLFPDDSIMITAWQTGSAGAYQGFKVTSQNTTGIVYTSGSTQTVTWNVVGTNGAPVNATNVDIYMSVDGGLTWPFTLGTFTNNGTATVTIPIVGASSAVCRIKVKGHGNVFFNINSNNFTVNPLAGVAPITGILTVCVGSTTSLADATPGGTWSSVSTGIATVSSSGVVTGVAAGADTISYVTSSGTVTAVVTVNPLPTVTAIAGGAVSICTGGTATMTDATTGGVWSSSNTAIATVNTSGVVTGVSGGTVHITYAVTNLCGTASTTTTLTVNSSSAITTAPVVTPPATTPCSGSTAVYTATCAGATTFNWTVTGTGWSGSSTTGSLTANVGSGAGQIIVYGINACGNGPSDTVNIVPNTVPATPSVVLSGTLPCVGATTGTYIATSTGATSYVWTVLGTGWSGASTTNTINVTLGTGTGTMICTGVNSCGNSRPDTSFATASPLPATPAVSLAGPAPCIGVTSTVYSAVSSGATSYSWTVLGTGWSGASATSSLTVNIGSGTGTIICSGINSCGSGTSDTVYLTPSSGVGSASPIFATTGVCSGSTATFITSAITGATSYMWTVGGAGWSGTSASTMITLTVGTGAGVLSVAGVGPCGVGPSYTLVSIVPVTTPTASFTLGSHIVSLGSGDLVTYSGSTFSSGTYSWNFGGGTAVPGTGIGPHMVTWPTTGLKTVTLSVTDTGCTSAIFSDTVLVVVTTETENPNSNILGVSIVPNPSNGLFDILFNENISEPVSIRLTDMQGRIIYNTVADKTVNNKLSVDVQYLPNGIYTATIIANGGVVNRKVIVSR